MHEWLLPVRLDSRLAPHRKPLLSAEVSSLASFFSLLPPATTMADDLKTAQYFIFVYARFSLRR